MSRTPRFIRSTIGRSKLLTAIDASLGWKYHLFKDWWGTRVWTRTTEVTTPLGFKLTSGFHPAYQLMRTGKFEVEETAVITRLLEQVDRFVDIGANLGYYSCLALQHGKPVVAFEPQAQNLQCLFQNLIANGWQDQAEVFPIALSEKPGLLTLYGASGPSASLLKDWAGYSSRYQKTVAVSTLDNILAGRFAGERLFIKIDVEGAEFQVLRGAMETLSRATKPIWIMEVCLQEFHPGGRNPDFENVFSLFFRNGYRAYTAAQVPELVSQEMVQRWARDNLTGSGTFNYVFIDAQSTL